MKRQREMFGDKLPGAACSQNMRESISAYAQEMGISESAAIRMAVSFFLKNNYIKNAEKAVSLNQTEARTENGDIAW